MTITNNDTLIAPNGDIVIAAMPGPQRCWTLANRTRRRTKPTWRGSRPTSSRSWHLRDQWADLVRTGGTDQGFVVRMAP